MIIYPASLLLSVALDQPLSLPRICWQTFTRDTGILVTASSQAADGPADMPLEPSTHGYWKPVSMPATWMIDFGTTRQVDYVGIAEHTLGTNGVSVLVETSMGDVVGSPPIQVWTVLGGSVLPADDAPLLFLDEARDARFMRITLTGSVAPKLSAVYTGMALAMPMTPQMGYPPITLNRRTELQNTKSRGGQFLAQGIKQMGVESTVTFQRLQQDFYRDSVDPFVKAARQFPYFFASNPERYPEEVAYVWTTEDIHPAYSDWDHLGVSWLMEGIGNL